MIETATPPTVDLVACETCLKEIPKSVCLCAEANDYVAYFCGLECYEEWSAELIRERTLEAGEP